MNLVPKALRAQNEKMLNQSENIINVQTDFKNNIIFLIIMNITKKFSKYITVDIVHSYLF